MVAYDALSLLTHHCKSIFQVKNSSPKSLLKHQRRIARRLRKQNFADQANPMCHGGNIHYEIAERTGAISCGGLVAMHTLAQLLRVGQSGGYSDSL